MSEPMGHRIKMLRLQRGMTQSALVQGLFDRTYISRIESGKIVPPLANWQLLAERMNVPLSTRSSTHHPFTRPLWKPTVPPWNKPLRGCLNAGLNGRWAARYGNPPFRRRYRPSFKSISP